MRYTPSRHQRHLPYLAAPQRYALGLCAGQTRPRTAYDLSGPVSKGRHVRPVDLEHVRGPYRGARHPGYCFRISPAMGFASQWPALFGSIAEAYSLRRFWGVFWHRLHVAVFEAYMPSFLLHFYDQQCN